jgi:hypothetical protein
MVVIAVGMKEENGLLAELESAGLKVHVIGDAKEPRQAIDANREGHELGIAL